ncbi:MAG: uracil-DNA glycosylase family protein, partial [Brevinematales bacterium]
MGSFDPYQALFCYLTGEWPGGLLEKRSFLASEDELSLALEKVRQKVLSCRSCSLYQTAKRSVFADGNPHTPLVFVGEAPGEEEDNQGLPFVGRAGKLLTATLEKFGVSRNQVYI